MGKIITKNEYKTHIKDSLRIEKKKVVLCHGVFDLVHPGHMIHFEQAKKLGDVLIVSITSSKYVRKGLGRPYFNDNMRMMFLEAIEYIDYVMLSEGYTVDDIIEVVEPDFYVKGEEYKNDGDDITGKINEEKRLVEAHGGRLVFTGGEVYSSTRLINNALSGLPEEVQNYMREFKEKYTLKDIREYTEKIKKLKILVIGDTIVDKYTYCHIQGTMSKDTGYSSRLQNSEEYFGGAVAIARHLSTFTNRITLLSVIGSEGEILERMQKELACKMNLCLICSKSVPTIIKHRYLTKNQKREEYRKIFSVNNIPIKPGYESETKIKLMEHLSKKLEDCDVVFLCDFGHGLVDKDVINIVQEKAKYLVVNCQTNSSNWGMNIITKYLRADAFTVDQRELNLAYPMYEYAEDEKLQKLSCHLKGNGWLTRGAEGSYGIENGRIHSCPAFTLTVKDTVGAGDAFLALAGIFAAAGAPVEIGTFMGNIAGALEANIVGNKECVEKVNVLKFASTLLNV